jgi:fumarylacetoacetase
LSGKACFAKLTGEKKCLQTPEPFMSQGRETWKQVKTVLQTILSDDNPLLKDDQVLRKIALIPLSDVKMCLPVEIGDYTDFYSSKEHATNVGTMFRGEENALMPNWLHMPIAYHGRSSSIVVSGTNIVRPKGQTKSAGKALPVFGPSTMIDFELETGFFVGVPNKLGSPIKVNNALDHIFGMVLVNDWSARDIQTWSRWGCF